LEIFPQGWYPTNFSFQSIFFWLSNWVICIVLSFSYWFFYSFILL
jgi:hypothetical protein